MRTRTHTLQDTVIVREVQYKFASSSEKATVIDDKRKGAMPNYHATTLPAGAAMTYKRTPMCSVGFHCNP